MAEGIITNRKRISKPLINFTYTGKYKYINEGGGNWKIKFLTSGILQLEKNAFVDIFAVGGGADGSSTWQGGGSGETKTIFAQTLYSSSPSGRWEILEIGNANQNTTLKNKEYSTTTTLLDASRGSGSNGGSAGGDSGENGASDGDSTTIGTGQNRTTREFGENDGKLYAGGGGGINAIGGNGGGGDGATTEKKGTDGLKNTGSGGGGGLSSSSYGKGGSGIIIIRNSTTVKISTNPLDITTAVNTYADFTITAEGRVTSYQWQFSPPNGQWSNTTLPGYNTPTLHVQAMSYRNNYQYRCIVTGAKNSVTSEPATLTITGISKSSINLIDDADKFLINDADKFRE